MMKQATKTLAVLVLALIASIPAFAFMVSTPKPVASSTAERTGVVTVGKMTFSEPVITVPETKVVVFKAKKYASLIDGTSNQPPCGAGFWASKRGCKLGGR